MTPRYEKLHNESGPVAVIDHWANIPLNTLKAALVADVKVLAQEKIVAILPEYMQRNLTARAAELAAVHAGLTPNNYPEPDRSEWMAGAAKWTKIKAIRAASNLIEAEIAALADRDALFAYSETLNTNPLWPQD
jgi:hypothetical protein